MFEKSLKVLEFSLKIQGLWKCLIRFSGNALKVLEFYQPVLKIARENNKFAALVLSLHTNQWWTLLSYRLILACSN